MKKQLLIFSWEYYGYHSIGGAALSRRVRQVAESFEKNGWEVTVVYKDQRNECENKPYIIKQESDSIRRIPVSLEKSIYDYNKLSLLRRLQTFYFVAFRGDRSYEWAKKVLRYFKELDIKKPDLIISFFTPRGPWFLGNHYSKKLGVPWIADFQDSYDEGLSGRLTTWSQIWTKKILKTATAITHVSPEWAERDGNILGLKIDAVRHAVPEYKIKQLPADTSDSAPSFKIFYGGSLNEQNQSLAVLGNALHRLPDLPLPIEILIAGTKQVYDVFERELGDKVKVTHLNWLDSEAYIARILSSNCTLVIPWSTNTRQVIPSKFYELCSLNKPVWIIGEDTGSFTYLLDEWKHPVIPFDDIAFQRRALIKAVKGDYSGMFNMESCKENQIKESDLFRIYTSYIRQ